MLPWNIIKDNRFVTYRFISEPSYTTNQITRDTFQGSDIFSSSNVEIWSMWWDFKMSVEIYSTIFIVRNFDRINKYVNPCFF